MVLGKKKIRKRLSEKQAAKYHILSTFQKNLKVILMVMMSTVIVISSFFHFFGYFCTQYCQCSVIAPRAQKKKAHSNFKNGTGVYSKHNLFVFVFFVSHLHSANNNNRTVGHHHSLFIHTNTHSSSHITHSSK